jgi:hypothetical protein
MPSFDLARIGDLTTIVEHSVSALEHFTSPALNVVDQELAAAKKSADRVQASITDLEPRYDIAKLIAESKKAGNSRDYWENIIRSQLQQIGNPPRADFEGKEDHYEALLGEARNQHQRENARVAELEQRKLRVARTAAEQQSALQQKVQETRALAAAIRAAGSAAGDTEHGKLLHKIKELAELTPDSLHADFLQQLEINAKAAVYDREAAALRQSFRDRFAAQLSVPGARDSVELTGTFGVKFGLIANLGIQWQPKISYEVSVSDRGEISVKRATNQALDLSVWAADPKKIASLDARVKSTVELAREHKYDSVDDFVNAEADRLAKGFLEASMTVNPLAIHSFLHMKKQEDRAINLRDTARNQKQSLEQAGTFLGILAAGDEVTVPKIRDVDYTSVESKSIAVGASGKLGVTDLTKRFKFELGGSAEIKKTWEREVHTVGYLDHLKTRPAVQELLTLGRPEYFALAAPDGGQLTGEAAARELRDLLTIAQDLHGRKLETEATIAGARAVLDDATRTATEKAQAQQTLTRAQSDLAGIDTAIDGMRRRMRAELEDVASEYDHLVQLESLAQRSGTPPPALASVRKQRGAKSSVEHLKALTAQYACLRRIYDHGFVHADDIQGPALEFEQRLGELEHRLRHPEFAMDVDEYEKHFKAHEVKEGIKYKYKAVGTLEAGLVLRANGFLGGEVERSGKWNPKTGEVSEDTHTFRAKIKGGVKLSDFLKEAVNAGELGNPEVIKQQIQDALGTKLFTWPSVDVGYTGTAELSIVKKHDAWRLKHIRVSDEASVGLGGVVPIRTGLTTFDMGAGIARKHVQGRYQWMGSDNLDGWADTYEGLKLRRQDMDWTDFKEKNRTALDNMLDNLKNTGSGITKDMTKAVDDLDDDVKAEWETALAGFRAGTLDRPAMLAKFEKVMDKRVEKSRAERFKDFTARVKTETFEEYATQIAAGEVGKFAGENGIPEAEAGSLESVLSWARKRFKTDRSEVGFRVMQKAFALEHGVRSLEDALASHNPKQTLAAESGILDGTYFKSTYDKPKVYIQKGISGTLERGEAGGTEWVDIKVVANKGVRGPDDIKDVVNAKTGDLGVRIAGVTRKVNDGSEVDYFAEKSRPSLVRNLFSTTKRAKIREQLAKVLAAQRKRKRDLDDRRDRMERSA